MKHKTIFYLGFFIVVMFLACKKENNMTSEKQGITEQQTSAGTTSENNSGAVQVAGIGYYAANGECDILNPPATFALKLTGDFTGCLYVFIDDYECSPSGTYREEGREYFVGTYNGQAGTFWTSYKFEAKYEGCDGGPIGAEIFGRCQHPITAGSGTGVFNGVTGRLDFKDDIEEGNFPYRGHLRY